MRSSHKKRKTQKIPLPFIARHRHPNNKCGGGRGVVYTSIMYPNCPS